MNDSEAAICYSLLRAEERGVVGQLMIYILEKAICPLLRNALQN